MPFGGENYRYFLDSLFAPIGPEKDKVGDEDDPSLGHDISLLLRQGDISMLVGEL